MTKGAVLQIVTDIEWSGYGPIVKTDSGYELLDFYYLSSGDTSVNTDLDAMALQQAWQLTMADGHPLEALAWVHCHPNGMAAFWSGVDELAVKDCLRYQGSDDAEQVSILFSGRTVIARRDTRQVQEKLKVHVRWGALKGDVERARELQKKRTAFQYQDACAICGNRGLTLTCDGCGKDVCLGCFFSIGLGKLKSLCIKCATAEAEGTCEACLESEAICVFCEGRVCRAHEGRVHGQVICAWCLEVLYGNT